MHNFMKISLVVLSVISSYLFLTIFNSANTVQFLFVAIPLILVNSVAAYYTKSMLRLGFSMVVISNIFWILARQIENYIVGHEILPQYRYDNDIFHLLLIISTFIIYKAVSTGEFVDRNK